MNQVSKTIQCQQSNAWAIIGNAIFWAAAILVASKLSVVFGGDNWTITGLLTACWFAAHTVIQRNC